METSDGNPASHAFFSPRHLFHPSPSTFFHIFFCPLNGALPSMLRAAKAMFPVCRRDRNMLKLQSSVLLGRGGGIRQNGASLINYVIENGGLIPVCMPQCCSVKGPNLMLHIAMPPCHA